MQPTAFNKIIIIDSIPIGEVPTANDLFYDNLKWKVLFENCPSIERVELSHKIEFLNRLDTICRECVEEGIKPIIHLEMHGNEDGLVLSSGDCISWEEILPRLRVINAASKNNLTLVIAACYSARLFDLVPVHKHAPFWALVAPLHEVFPDDVRQFSTFYEELLREPNFPLCVDRMNAKILDPMSRFRAYNSEDLFNKVWLIYEGHMQDPQIVNARVEDLMKLHQEKNGTLSPTQARMMRSKYRNEIVEFPNRDRRHMKDIFQGRADESSPLPPW